MMALERRIAVAVLVVGLAIVVVAVFGCGEDAEDERLATPCGDRHLSMQVAGARLINGGERIRLAYAGAEPCNFAVDLHKGILYVELRSGSSHDNSPPFPSGCVEGTLVAPVEAGTPVERISIGKPLLDSDEVGDLLSGDQGCGEILEGQANFIID